MKKNRKFNIVCLVLVIIYVALVIVTNIYYNNNYKILECVHIIGPMNKCISVYQEGQESIVSLYKALVISSYLMLCVNLVFNFCLLVFNHKNKQRQILPMMLTIAFGIVAIFLLIYS